MFTVVTALLATATSEIWIQKCEQSLCKEAEWATTVWNKIVKTKKSIPVSFNVHKNTKEKNTNIKAYFEGCTTTCNITVQQNLPKNIKKITLLHELGHVTGFR